MCYKRAEWNNTKALCYSDCVYDNISNMVGHSIQCQAGNRLDTFSQTLMLMYNATSFPLHDGDLTSNNDDFLSNCKIGISKYYLN